MGVEYGLEVLLSGYYFYLKDIKSKMDYINYFGEMNGFKYNLSLTGTVEQNNLVPKDNQDLYYSLHPIKIFNTPNFVYIKKGYETIINPCFESIFSTFVNEIDENYSKLEIIYNIVLGIFVTAILVCYFGVWVRFEQKLNNTIYKTKNMLSIIPVNVLCNIPTVFQVLEIKSMTKNADGKREIQSTEESIPLINATPGSTPGITPASNSKEEKQKE